ncbi:2-keto-4-pentenoate hydratase [Maritimibacter sp. 55A14]|uniref:fumarylacetoacetate hydrolase family protein n=1 Tax=Maritimibacter sp. 55A14 TaxID=2174844 RepID=UPI000D617446|nr:fumarylacetoacetate hydrolase family protein [Maritimibacter sp. 55A14]PWE32421.1 2-keto-4-pentenoate hydratase [Maritimibacter sp. 55A14]
MKFATLADDAHRDGRAVAVSDDLTTCRAMPVSLLDMLAQEPNAVGPRGPEMPFAEADALAPLPRAAQFLDGSAYVNHVALVRQARGAAMPESFWTDPLIYQGCPAPCLPATAPITGDPNWGIDFEAEVAVITGDVPQGANPEAAAAAIRLVMLCNDISLRNLVPGELAKGFGFLQSKPPNAFSPVAVTPDALPGWDGRKLHGALRVDLNGQPFGRADAGRDMTFDFGQLLAHAARTRPLPAGTILGSGTVSNRGADGGPGRTVAAGGAGYSCIAEQRMVETILTGAPVTPFLQPGDRARIWMEDDHGRSIFGTIAQEVQAP